MDRVQTALNEYFSSKSFFRSSMSLNFLFYGGGLLFLVIGSFFNFTGRELFLTIGQLAFLLGIVLTLAKKDTIGLIIAFSIYALMHAVLMIIMFVGIFTVGAALLVNFFAEAIYEGLSILFLLLSIHKLPSYQIYKQQRIAAQAAAAQAAAAQAAAAAAYAAAHPQAPYAPPYAPPAQAAPANACTSCGFPLAPDAVFCPKCGTKQEKPEKKVCAGCGTELAPDAAFCVKCGAKV